MPARLSVSEPDATAPDKTTQAGAGFASLPRADTSFSFSRCLRTDVRVRAQHAPKYSYYEYLRIEHTTATFLHTTAIFFGSVNIKFCERILLILNTK
jgi:hypothetical protein